VDLKILQVQMFVLSLFLKQVLEFLGIKLSLPIVVRVDNVGAVYLLVHLSLINESSFQ
jgi:hypothetical protein